VRLVLTILAFCLTSSTAFAEAEFDENHAFKPDKVDEVIALAGEQLKRDPVDARALMVRGLALVQKGDLAAAISDYQAAIEINPIDIGALPLVIFRQLYPKYASLAQSGDAKAEYGIGQLFEWHCDDVRNRVDQSLTAVRCKELAGTLLQRSAEHGFVVAQREFGKKIYKEAIDSNPGKCHLQFGDVQQARVWLKRAADQNDADAMSEMATTYLPTLENCSFQDHFSAMDWYFKALVRMKETGRGEGILYEFTLMQLWGQQIATGVDLMEGRYVPQNFEQASKWLTAAAIHGSPEAQYRLGQLYLRGRGVIRNEVEALKWFILASPKRPEAAKQRDLLNGALSAGQVSVAQRGADRVLQDYKNSEWYVLEKY
jgi:TPR repeat protein